MHDYISPLLQHTENHNVTYQHVGTAILQEQACPPTTSQVTTHQSGSRESAHGHTLLVAGPCMGDER